MSAVTDLIKKDILRTEKNIFIFTLVVVLAAYVGTTLWLNAIRQTAPLSFVWVLIILQLFLFLSIFVACSMRLRQCNRHAWWIWAPLLLSRVNNWELALIPATAVVVLILSECNTNVSHGRQHLVPKDEDSTETT